METIFEHDSGDNFLLTLLSVEIMWKKLQRKRRHCFVNFITQQYFFTTKNVYILIFFEIFSYR